MHKIVVFLSLLLVIGCGGSEPKSKAPAEQATTNPIVENVQPVVKQPKQTDVAVTSTPSKSGKSGIAGVVRYEGKIPKFREIKMDADPVCLTHHKSAVFPQTLVLGDVHKNVTHCLPFT